MDKKVCTLKTQKNSENYTVNCAGEKVLVVNEGFTSRCAVGNTDDYLNKFKTFVSSDFLLLGDPPSISIVIPSFASGTIELFRTLISLCSQEYPVPAEILVFINEPKDTFEGARKVNDINEKFLRSIIAKDTGGFSDEFLELRKELLYFLEKNKSRLNLHCLRQIIEGGLAGVYQIVIASAMARGRAFCGRMSGNDRDRKIQCIKKNFHETLIFLFDDDLLLESTDAIAKAYSFAIDNNAVILGRLKIKQVDISSRYQGLLRDIMQLFLDFKHDRKLNFLSPRAMSLSRILEIGGVQIGQSFADQLFFASAVQEGPRYFIDALTTIEESDHPGNGNFLKKFRLYLQGEDNDALSLFENVLARYQESSLDGKYCSNDIENMISVLKTRDIEKINSVVSGLISRV